ncbi:MAG: C25 family cysteine peptidase, partial [Ignavibacteria bacterium]|nr:C25 family cysteine peptidase [Ignavibacteria bacterium]
MKYNLRSFSPFMAITLAVFVIFTADVTFGQQYNYTGNWGPAGFSVTRSSAVNLELNFSVNKLFLEDVNVDGMTMKAAKIPGIFLPNDAGKPDLAGTGKFIAIPQGAAVNYKIISYRTEKYYNVDIAPAPVIPRDNEPGPLRYQKDMGVFAKNSFYPESPVMISSPMKIRGVDVVTLGITPLQYNPSTKELIVYTDIKVEVNFAGGNGHFGNDVYRSIWFDPILEDAIINYSSLPKLNYETRNLNWQKLDAYGYEYVIICPNVPVFLQWADSVKNFRIAQGIKTGIFTLSQIGGNDATLIKNFLLNAWTNWTVKPVAALLLGDYNPSISANALTSPIYNSYCVSDNILGDMDNNHLPDIVMARMTAQDATELETMITKFLKFERTPPTDPNYYNKPITALGWQTERWFQICSEAVGGFWKKTMGKNPTRINAIYSGSPSTTWSTATNTATVVNYFGPAGTYYIPLTPDSLGGWSGGTAQMVVNAINGGSFALQHRDHGSVTGWGEPAFQSSNISQLTNNNNNLCFIFSINCLTGKYNNSSESFAEKFHRYKYNGLNAGALGLIAASEVSYSFVNDCYVWGMMDNFWPNFMPTYGTTPASRDFKPAFGNAAGKYFLYQSSWPYNTSNKEVTYHLFHHHSDAFLNLYSEVPQNLTVSHASVILSGVNTFNVSANAGAFIAITKDTSILGTATATGTTQSISIPGTQLPGQILKVVVTKQNYFRYEAPVSVIPPTGPYVVKDTVILNDASPLGNGNGKMDYGETNKLSLRVKNVGSATATGVNVKVSESDPYVTMTDSTESYGDIGANATMLKTDAFTYTVANNIPDGRQVNFTVTATSGSNSWISSFSITGHSAILKKGAVSINDSAGNNNGRWDAGETVGLKVCARNNGSASATNVVGVLSESDPFITIVTNNLNYGTIAANDSTVKQFSVSSAANTPVGYTATMLINYTA